MTITLFDVASITNLKLTCQLATSDVIPEIPFNLPWFPQVIFNNVKITKRSLYTSQAMRKLHFLWFDFIILSFILDHIWFEKVSFVWIYYFRRVILLARESSYRSFLMNLYDVCSFLSKNSDFIFHIGYFVSNL